MKGGQIIKSQFKILDILFCECECFYYYNHYHDVSVMGG